MPGFVTHHVFGVKAYKRLSPSLIKQYIKEHPNAYTLGLQGPDLFFYYLLTSSKYMPNYADMLHKSKTNSFFDTMLRIADDIKSEEDKKIAYGYIAGFIGHYLLDTTLHPYVYARVGVTSTKSILGKHFGLETDIDRDILWHYKKIREVDFSHSKAIRPTAHETRVIARLLCDAMRINYKIRIKPSFIKLTIKCMHIESLLLVDKYRIKNTIFRVIEDNFIGFQIVSPMLINNVLHSQDPCNEAHNEWVSPYDPFAKIHRESVFDIMDDLTETAVTCFGELDNIINKKPSRLLHLLGNKSYNTGNELTDEPYHEKVPK